MSPEVHPSAALGFERAVEHYERGRPGFRRDAMQHVIQRLGIRRGRSVLDLAAGTGKLTRELASTGARITAVEPVTSMRATLAAVLPAVSVVGGVAEALPFHDASFDAITAAQAFHWFDPTTAIPELHRVLRRDGGVALIWNVRDEDDVLQASLTRLMEPYRGDTPSYRGARWRDAFAATDRFASLELATFRNEQHLSPDGVVDRVLSVSFIATQAPASREGIAHEVRMLIGDREEVVLPYRTDVWTTRRSAG